MASKAVHLVLERLENVAELSSGWSALCPSHADTNNSLSINEGADGRALIHCHAGCDYTDILQAIGLQPRDLFVRPGGAR